MDQATLVGPDINVGNEVLAALDVGGLKRITALLAVFPEYGDWRLVLSSPSLDAMNRLDATEKIYGILQGRFTHLLPPLMLFTTKDSFIRELHKMFGKTANVQGMRLGGQMIGGRFIEAAYIYRIA
jgi:hypothetical protein